ncbi:MAG: 4Fe-4S binding protein [Planctomycetota bacterium]|nr:MAG: 4Fe-4S binding protein [Planctomycetota bacterium]
MMSWHRLRHLGLQTIRRFVQLSVIGVVMGVVLLSLYAHYRAARALDDEQLVHGWKGVLLHKIDDAVGQRPDADRLLDGFKGTLWSMRLAGYDITDPLAAAEMTATSKTLYVPLLISTVLPLLVTLVLGRVFCSWMCPAGLLFEITGKLRGLLRMAELAPGEVHFSHRNKYILLVVGLLVAGVVGLPVFALIYPPAVLSRMAHAWIFGTALTGMTVLMLLIILFELFVSPRWWCRTMCPGGALYGLVGWTRLLRVRLDTSLCTGCKDCIPVCEEGINPITQSDSIECDNCGVCIRHCDDAALFYTIGLPGHRVRMSRAGDVGRSRHALPVIPETPASDVAPRTSAKPADPAISPKRRRAFARRSRTVVPLLLLALLPARAEAHHILGLPHYSYSENYPQNPTFEYPAQTGPYDVVLTCYPGRPNPGEPANLSFYIKNRNTGAPYTPPVVVRVLQTFTFGRNREILPPTSVEPFEVTHQLSATFPETGEYVVELKMDVEGKPEVIPFALTVGDETATASVLVAAGTGLALFLIIVRAIKIKQRRRIANAVAPAVE